MQLPLFVTKTFAYIRGLTLGCILRVINGTSLSERFPGFAKTLTDTVKADMETMLTTGSPYSALTIGNLSGLGNPAAQATLDEMRAYNRQRNAEIEERRKQRRLAGNLS